MHCDGMECYWQVIDLSDKIKRDFFTVVAVSIQLYRCTIWSLTKRLEKKLYENHTRHVGIIWKEVSKGYYSVIKPAVIILGLSQASCYIDPKSSMCRISPCHDDNCLTTSSFYSSLYIFHKLNYLFIKMFEL